MCVLRRIDKVLEELKWGKYYFLFEKLGRSCGGVKWNLEFGLKDLVFCFIFIIYYDICDIE